MLTMPLARPFEDCSKPPWTIFPCNPTFPHDLKLAVTARLQGAVIKGANLAPTKEDVVSSNPAASHVDLARFKLVRDVSRFARSPGL